MVGFSAPLDVGLAVSFCLRSLLTASDLPDSAGRSPLRRGTLGFRPVWTRRRPRKLYAISKTMGREAAQKARLGLILSYGAHIVALTESPEPP